MRDPSASADVIVAGHVCLDIIPQLYGPVDVAPGRLLNIGPAAVSTGGAVANTGVALHRLGVPVRLMGKLGDDALGRSLLDLLRTAGPRLGDGMIITPGEATSYSIVISPPGIDRSFLHCPGANDTFVASDVRDEAMGGARLLHFGYPPIMRRMRERDGEQLRELFGRARAAGLTTTLDMCQPDPASEAGATDWPAFLDRVLPYVDLFLPSIDELLFMLDRGAFDRGVSSGNVSGTAVRQLGRRILDMGSAVAVIKLGERGLYLRTTHDATRLAAMCDRVGAKTKDWLDREVLSPCFRAKEVAGTTGSGDCTIAGFLTAVLRGEGPVGAATAATAVGACSVEVPDATGGVPPWPDVAERVAAGWARHPVSIDVGKVVADDSGTITLNGGPR